MLDAERINALLPQTQCTRCGYPDCASYARAIVQGQASINQCPPGGQEGIERLARATGLAPAPLSAEYGAEGPRRLAVIDEAACIGCTLCIQACPVDCIVGAPQRMHTVIENLCTGCELCVPACPVDCIGLTAAHSADPAPTGWAAWGAQSAAQARRRHEQKVARLQAHAAPAPASAAAAAVEPRLGEQTQRRAAIQAALSRARSRRPGQSHQGDDKEPVAN